VTTVLIADDRPANRQMLMSLLGYSGHRLLEAADGVQALAAARAERPDLAIVDLREALDEAYCQEVLTCPA